MTQYATRAELATFGLPSGWLEGVSESDQDAALLAASQLADGYLGQRYALPLSAWGSDIKRAVCHIASWDLMCRRGFDPENAADAAIRLRYTDALAWLKGIAAGTLTPTGVVDSTVDSDEGGAFMVSNPRRRWLR
jgi:phage gp36-like protein